MSLPFDAVVKDLGKVSPTGMVTGYCGCMRGIFSED